MVGGAGDKTFWSTKAQPFHGMIASFKSEVKDYYWGQGAFCCYCSHELQSHGRTFDAEHIIDKSTFPQFMFEVNNLAASCVICNSHKSAKCVLSAGEAAPPPTVPVSSDAYLIVHPHLDEWGDHFYFDEGGRVVARPGSAKGKATMNICKIYSMNLVRLATSFQQKNRRGAYELMCHIATLKNNRKIAELLIELRALAADSSAALAVIESFESALAEHK